MIGSELAHAPPAPPRLSDLPELPCAIIVNFLSTPRRDGTVTAALAALSLASRAWGERVGQGSTPTGKMIANAYLALTSWLRPYVACGDGCFPFPHVRRNLWYEAYAIWLGGAITHRWYHALPFCWTDRRTLGECRGRR
jgi:hypothetical protein